MYTIFPQRVSAGTNNSGIVTKLTLNDSEHNLRAYAVNLDPMLTWQDMPKIILLAATCLLAPLSHC